MPDKKFFPQQDILSSISPVINAFEELYSAEQEHIRGSAEKRVSEYSSARVCARKILKSLGINQFPLLSGKNREPVWPDGIAGSITHCRDLVGVAATANPKYLALGIDIENIKRLRYDISRHVCTNIEHKWLTEQDSEKHDLLVMLIFSIKESIYKALYHSTETRAGFKDFSIKPELPSGQALLEIHNSLYSQYLQDKFIHIYFQLTDTHIYSGAVIQSLP